MKLSLNGIMLPKDDMKSWAGCTTPPIRLDEEASRTPSEDTEPLTGANEALASCTGGNDASNALPSCGGGGGTTFDSP